MDKNLIMKIYGLKYYNKLNKQIKSLGTRNKLSIVDFMNIRLYISIFVAIVPIIIHLLNNDMFKSWYIISPLLFIVVYLLMKYIMIDLQLENRKKLLEKEAYYFFEVLTLTLETGRNLEKSIEITCTYVNNNISDEFKQMLFHMKLGKSLKESLDSMRERIPSDDINNVILNISEASSFGTSIVKMMKNQLEYLNQKQILQIREEINKMPNKISIISVLFIVPLLFVLILSPIIIKMFF